MPKKSVLRELRTIAEAIVYEGAPKKINGVQVNYYRRLKKYIRRPGTKQEIMAQFRKDYIKPKPENK